jgi:GMP synthase-like glutamine amidotransferase
VTSHVSFEYLDCFEAPLREAGYDVEYVDAAERDPTHLDPLGTDVLVVLGGPIASMTEWPIRSAKAVCPSLNQGG